MGFKKGNGKTKLYFWRTQNKAEVDFILEAPQKLYPLEVNKSGKSTRALYAFMSYYKEDKGYVGRFFLTFF